MKICYDSFNGECSEGLTTVKVEYEEDFKDLIFITFQHIIIPINLKEIFINDVYGESYNKHILSCFKKSKIEYIDFKYEMRMNKIDRILKLC